MNIVINKETNEILFLNNEVSLDKVADIKQEFPDFDEKIMEFGCGDFDALPDNFDIIDNKIVPLSLEEALNMNLISIDDEDKVVDGVVLPKSVEELISEGIVNLAEDEKVENGEIIMKTLKEQVEDGLIVINEPFEFVNDNDEVDYHSISYLVNNGLIETKEHADFAIDVLNESLEGEIRSMYSTGYELKITKDFIEWLQGCMVSMLAGNEERELKYDKRCERYNDMQSDIDRLKEDYRGLKLSINKLFS